MPTTRPTCHPRGACSWLQDHAIASSPRSRPCSARSAAPTPAVNPAPYWMAETTIRLRPRARVAEGSARALVLERATAPCGGCARRLRPSNPETPAELIDELDSGDRLPERWTAPARAHRHDGDGRPHAVGVRVIAPDPERIEVLATAVSGVVGAARYAQRRPRSDRRRNVVVVRPRGGRPRPLRRRACISREIVNLFTKAGNSARSSTTGAAARPGRVAQPATAGARQRATRLHRPRRGANRRSGLPIPLGSRPADLRAAAGDGAHRARRARRLRLRRPAAGTDVRDATSSAPAAR